MFIKIFMYSLKREKDIISKLSLSNKEDGWEYNGFFYGIQPTFGPIAPGMVALCVNNKNTFPFNTESITIMYDPYNYSECSFKFITFIIPHKNTFPIFVYKRDKEYFITTIENDSLEPDIISPLYTFKDPVLFSYEQGICVPVSNKTKNGLSLKSCLKKITTKPLTLLDMVRMKTDKQLSVLRKVLIILIILSLIFYRKN